MKVLGIDPGTASCGYALVVARDGRLRALAHGCWTTSPRTPLAERLGALHEGVTRLLADPGADVVALEESYVGADPRTALAVGQARGAIMAAAARAGVPCAEYAPARVKAAVCGYGRAEKGQVARMVGVILRLDSPPATTHAADALAVAVCHALASPLARAVG